MQGRIPELDTVGHAAPWRDALKALGALRIVTLVPAYGPPGPPQPMIAATEAYLARLEADVRTELERGARLEDVQHKVSMAEWRGWAQYRRLQPANVRRQFLSAEAQWTAGQRP